MTLWAAGAMAVDGGVRVPSGSVPVSHPCAILATPSGREYRA